MDGGVGVGVWVGADIIAATRRDHSSFQHLQWQR